MNPLLIEWLGTGGKPVPRGVAEARAVICVNCPNNVQPSWWEKFTKDPVGRVIKAMLGLKHDMMLSTREDGLLAMCRVCGCCNQLKIWVPLKSIVSESSPSQMAEYPSHCWIAIEGAKEMEAAAT